MVSWSFLSVSSAPHLRDNDAKPVLKGLWRPFLVALLIYFCLDQMAPGSCDWMAVLLITIFISPSAQFKGQVSCNTFASKINHSSPLLLGHRTSDICTVPHYTPKLLDLLHVFINSITKARWSFRTSSQQKDMTQENFAGRMQLCGSPKAFSLRPFLPLWRWPWKRWAEHF